ncbi:MAG: alkaline phosphatase family protein [Spirochaetes bacterium]|nr:alkaline phosphatase family protein [Spirochaetota bacterium]
MKKNFLLLVTLFLIAPIDARHRLIVWSIDGFAAGYLDRAEFQNSKVWRRLLKSARVFRPVETILPSVTYPAHTSMVTGVNAAQHKIYSNHPVDPFNFSKEGWTWFSEDIAVPTLWESAAKAGRSVVNIQWPVTMMSPSKIRYSIPQFDRARGPEEEKMMRVLSTPGLYDEIEQHTQIALTEYSGDDARVKVARYLWKKKQPDLLLLYTPGLDSVEHAAGPYSPAAFRQLEILGHLIESFLVDLRRASNRDKIQLLIVSDHGFTTYRGKCFPNAILNDMGYIDAKNKTWSYVFDTSGGVARLVGKAGAAPFATRAFTKKLNAACPGIEAIGPESDEYESWRRRYARSSPLFLVSRTQTLLAPAIRGGFYMPNARGFTHGFLPERDDMHTLALLFGADKKYTRRITNVKDTYSVACSWLKLHCPHLQSSAAGRPRR